MKRKKGFTLIELLATVIILAIVLLIAVPKILNTIENTRKRAFVDNVIAYSVATRNYLDTGLLNGEYKYPSKFKYNLFDIDKVSPEQDEYSGEILILTNINDKKLFFPYMTNGKYYVCGVDIEILSYVHVASEPCTMPNGEITISNGIDMNNKDTDGDSYPDILEESLGTDPLDPNSFPSNENLDNINITEDTNSEITKVKVNAPKLFEGLTPIKWVDSEIVTTTSDDDSWYDYSSDEKHWANAMSADGGIWVWIPRYAYKITSGYHTNQMGTIDIMFLKGNTNQSFNYLNSEPVNETQNPGSDSKFVTHPGFKFGDTELEGIWVMKFEPSNNGGVARSVPNVASWRDLTVSASFSRAREVELSSHFASYTSIIDTHLIKDSEWAVVAYLSRSIYGKYSKVWINNSSTYITGCAGNTVDAAAVSGCQNKYNTDLGANASSTGNYYGIYDMSGGAFERTASHIAGASTSDKYGATLVKALDKYKNLYIGSTDNSATNYNLNTTYYGNAMYEVSNSNEVWGGGTAVFGRTAGPFMQRGGSNELKSNTSNFQFSSTTGTAHTNNSFRVTMVVAEDL